MNVELVRKHSEHCRAQALATADELQRQRYLRAAAAWRQLAERKLVLDSALLPGDIAAAEELSKNAAVPA
jgi:hypothetical protein